MMELGLGHPVLFRQSLGLPFVGDPLSVRPNHLCSYCRGAHICEHMILLLAEHALSVKLFNLQSEQGQKGRSDFVADVALEVWASAVV